MSKQPGVSDMTSKISGGLPTDAVDPVTYLVKSVLGAGVGGTVTQGMVDQANTQKPVVDKANG
ncbi:hypothetical protein [Streptomyces sp. NPDC054854]